MAESTSTTPAINTEIPAGGFDEKAGPVAEAPPAKPKVEDEEEDEDIDALIEDLESHDGHGGADDDEEEEEADMHGARITPEDMLQTDTRIGLTEHEVVARRRRYVIALPPPIDLYRSQHLTSFSDSV